MFHQNVTLMVKVVITDNTSEMGLTVLTGSW